jgi:putative membrane protein
MPFIVRMLLQAVAILLIAWFFPSIVSLEGEHRAISALAAAFVLGLVNAVLRPIFILLTLPVTLATFGLFLLVINALLLGLVSRLVPGFAVNGFFGAILGSILISLVTWVLGIAIPRPVERDRQDL